jgi:nitrogen fixation/metabolism regulation signal transduction histidine kinase
MYGESTKDHSPDTDIIIIMIKMNILLTIDLMLIIVMSLVSVCIKKTEDVNPKRTHVNVRNKVAVIEFGGKLSFYRNS